MIVGRCVMVQIISLRELFPSPPIIIGTPARRPFYSVQDTIKYINQLNGIKRIFYSLYNNSNTVIDKVWFDLDSKNSFDNIKKLINYAQRHNYKFSVIFSGGGFHFYLFCKNENPLQSPKDVLAFLHEKIAQECGLIWGDPKDADLDEHCRADIARIVTAPGTFNLKRNKWAISLKLEELELGFDSIKDIADKQRNCIYVYGDKLFDVDEYKDIKREIKFNNVNIPDFEHRQEFNDDDLKKFPPCIQQILLDINSKGDWRGRWIATIFLKDWCYTHEEINKISKTYYNKIQRTDGNWTNYDHWRKLKVLDYVMNKDFSMPSCEEMYLEGRCPGKCKFYQEKGITNVLKKILR